MKILHLNAGNESGGGMYHILSLLNELNREEFYLGVFEKGEMYDRARSLDIQTVLFNQSSRFDFSILKEIIHFIRLNSIDIIHTHGARANCYGAMIRSFVDVKWMVTVHSDPRDDFMGRGLSGKLYTFLNLKALKQADHLLAISDRFKQILLDRSIPDEKITTILNGIDFDKELEAPLTREELGVKDGDFTIIMVARLEAVKGHKVALKAVRNLIENHHTNIKILLIGDGSEREALIKYSEEHGISGHVEFLGHRNDVERIYPIADVAILTSYSESFPLVLLEAARAGVPVMTTDVGGVDQLIPDDSYGWIIPVEDSDQLTESLESAMRKKKEGTLILMGEKIKKYSKRHFSVEQFANNVYNVYLKLGK
ncbi:glycosyltransferase family 4 protein [Bacillus sp. CH30_1T]|uniref:glycosyltransferase family 4 protein n=1 Tax=Bacillus sp. CH30_1T TaxID=2604836 RepID=UPI0011ED2984|nr:glycosyltransferase family 4 protein [Bacillus sp. CH30_1T]KAA0565872.1 glycosyltransferase family 4 protein [Bacillus sp. CH30_1T]